MPVGQPGGKSAPLCLGPGKSVRQTDSFDWDTNPHTPRGDSIPKVPGASATVVCSPCCGALSRKRVRSVVCRLSNNFSFIHSPAHAVHAQGHGQLGNDTLLYQLASHFRERLDNLTMEPRARALRRLRETAGDRPTAHLTQWRQSDLQRRAPPPCCLCPLVHASATSSRTLARFVESWRRA